MSFPVPNSVSHVVVIIMKITQKEIAMQTVLANAYFTAFGSEVCRSETTVAVVRIAVITSKLATGEV